MQNQNEIQKIDRFISLVLPIVTYQLKFLFKAKGIETRQVGHGLDTAFTVKSGEKEIEFYLYNLLLEIATIDRDEQPLRFDNGLRDFDYFVSKTRRLLESKLKVLFRLLDEDDVDLAIEKVSQLAEQYQRIRIIKLDQKDIS